MSNPVVRKSGTTATTAVLRSQLPNRQKSKKSGLDLSANQDDNDVDLSHKRHREDDSLQTHTKRPKLDLKTEAGHSYRRGYCDATAKLLKARVETLGSRLDDLSQEYRNVKRQLEIAKQDLDTVEKEIDSLE